MRAVAAFVALVVLALALTACGDDDTDTDTGATSTSSSTTESTTSSTTSEPPPDPSEPQPAADAVELEADVAERVEAGPYAWHLDVTNVTDADIVLTFPTGQPGDAVLLDGETEVHRWSDDRFFTQAIQEKPVAAGETFTIQLEDDLTSVEPGFYTLRLSLAVVGPPEPVEQSIRIVSAD